MLEGSDMDGRYAGSHVFESKGSFGGDAIRCEVIIEGGAQVCAVDQELERSGLLGLQQSIHKGGEGISAKVCRHEDRPSTLGEAQACVSGREGYPNLSCCFALRHF
jgi:hypothetical protein